MSQLLISWLNDEVQLSKRITNLQQDFYNGFLLGQLLSKYSQQLNFNQFVDKSDKTSKVKNFTLLYQTFKTLKVYIDSNIAVNIINKQQGAAMKILSSLKMQLEKTTNNVFNKTSKPNKPASPIKRVPLTKDTFDRVSKQHFTKQLNERLQSQKNTNLEKHLQKFQQFHQTQLNKVEQQMKKQSQAFLLKRSKFIQQRHQNLKKSEQFRNDWQKTNEQKWGANMNIALIRQQKDAMFKTKLQNTKIKNKTMSQMNAIRDLDKDLQDFEKKIKKQDDSDSDQKQDKVSPSNQPSLMKKPSVKAKATNQFGFSGTGSKFMGTGTLDQQSRKKKNPQQVSNAQHQRQKRRRKMIVQQSKKHQLIKIQRRQKYIINTLQQTSKQQKQIEYEIWRAWQNKQVIVRNKTSNDQKLKQKQQTRAINAKFKNQQLVKTFREEHQKQLKDGIDRQNKLKVQNSVKGRKKTYDECKSIIQKFIDMTQIVYDYGQQKNQQKLDDVFLTHLLDQFVNSTTNKKQIAELQLTNYINGKGQWNVQIKRENAEQPVDPTVDNSLPNTVVNNYYLGNILKTTFKQLYKQQQKNETEIANIKSQNLISILGLQFAGKKTLANKIKQEYGFNVIQISNIVEQKLKDYQIMKSKGLQIDGQTAQLVDICYNGKQIPNQIIINLLKQNIQKHQKSLIVNYPTTYEDCVEMTKLFGQMQPSDYTNKTKLTKKIQQFSRLVRPTQTKIIPRSLKPCGIDFAVWIDISPKTSLDRFLGRRWTPQGQCLHINKQIVNPNELIVGEKGSSVILKNDFKLKSIHKIKNWLNQFGVQVNENGELLVQRCWQTLSGQCSNQELTQKAFNLLNKALEVKSKKKLQIMTKQQQQKQNQKKKQEQTKVEQQLKQKCVLSLPQNIKQKFQQALNSVKMDSKFLQNIEKLWNNTEKLTINGLINVFQSLRDQSQSKNQHISSTKRNFIRILTREDERFYLVKKFQNQYNKFIDQNNDMVIQDYTKQQLHQRIQDLQCDLLTLIQQKKEDAQSQRQNIMKSGWLENQLQQIMSCIHIMLQIQLNRTFACQQIISDFYSKKYLVNTGEIQEPPNQIGLDSQLQIIKQNGFPRLQKLIAESTRIFNKQQQVVDDKNKKGGKAPPAKKEDKKQAKKGGKQEVQQKSEPTAEDLQYKKAINTQKAIFRYRVKVIQAFAAKKLLQFQQAGLNLYSDLENLYKYTDKVENCSVVQMTKIFKRAIQQEKKIENQVEINYIDVIESQSIRNFKKPKPIVLPAVQKVQPDRFTISSIKELIKLFKNQSQAKLSIKNNRLITLLEGLAINQRYKSTLPETWKTLTKQNHEKFVSRFDKNGKGQIQLWIVFTVIALSNCPLPTQAQIKQYQLNITDHNPLTKQVDQARVQSTNSWFDSQQPKQQNTRSFDRNKYLKQILFDVFKKQNDPTKVLVDKFITKLTLLQYNRNLQEVGKTYFDFAFGKQ